MPGETAAKVVQTKEPQHKDDFDEWLARIICFAFSVPPQWATKAMNRATADNQSAQSEEEGLEPTKEWVKDLVDEIVAEEFASPDLELHWLDEDEGDPETVLEGRVKLGAVTLNEMRDALGLDPYDNAAADRPMVLTATGFVPIEANAGGEGANAGAKADSNPVIKTFDPNQPRVPAGNSGGGQWTTGDGGGRSPLSSSGAASDEPEHPARYAARDTGTLTDETGGAPSSSPANDDSAEPAQQERLAYGANDNLTPEQTCRQAYADALARTRIDPSLSPDDYLDERRESSGMLELCLRLVNEERPISPKGDFLFFPGGGLVIFRRGRPPLYNPSPGGQ